MPFVTPEITPTENQCWRFSIPIDEQILGSILGQLNELTKEHNWEQTGGITVSETVAILKDVFDSFSVGNRCMIGSLIHYATTNPPDGVLACDGTQYLRVDYPKLYDTILASYIVDADNFVVPDIEDAFLLGAGPTYLVEDIGGEIDHTLVEAEMPAHIHQTAYPQLTVDIKSVGAPTIESASNPPIYLPSQSAGGNQSHNNMPPFVAFKIGIIAW